MRSRSILSVTMAAIMGVGVLGAFQTDAHASQLKSLQEQENSLKNKRSSVSDSIGHTNEELSGVKKKQTSVEREIQRLDFTISDTDRKIREKKQQIEQTKAEIEKLKAEIEELKQRIEKRNELLKERARNIQQNGGSVDYLDVLLGSESFSNFIDRVSAVTTLVNADKKIMEEQQRDKEKLEDARASVEKKLADIQSMLKELENMQAELKQQKLKKKELMRQLASQRNELENDKMNLQEESELLKAQEAAIQKAIKLEKNRIAEAARREAERQNSHNSGGGGGGGSHSAPPVSSGDFTRPAQGYISSGFGGRGGAYHYGIDIAAGGSVPIVAAADGVVIRSYYSSSYGNAVFISHSINGKQYTTVYAHMSSRSIGTGAIVSKGQLVGYMGNTGESSGQHLHFELHEGPWNAGKTNAVDPSRYIHF